METLHNHSEMIDLNPLVIDRHPTKAPRNATPEEFHCLWYSITDRVQYGVGSGKVTYNACFHDLEWGVQTHCYAPMGLDIKGKWTLGGSLPGEPITPVEIGLGAPLQGLYLREDVDMRCNVLMTAFVKKTTKKAHSTLIDRLVIKSQMMSTEKHNRRLGSIKTNASQAPSFSFSNSSTEYSPSEYEETPTTTDLPQLPFENHSTYLGFQSHDFSTKDTSLSRNHSVADPSLFQKDNVKEIPISRQYSAADPSLFRGYTVKEPSLIPEPLRSGRNSSSSNRSNNSHSSNSDRPSPNRHNSFEFNTHPSQRLSHPNLHPRAASRSPSPSRQQRASSRPRPLEDQEAPQPRRGSHVDEELFYEAASRPKSRGKQCVQAPYPYPNPNFVQQLFRPQQQSYVHAELEG